MGISKSVANNSNRLVSISKVGTPLYTSPEQIRKQPFNFKVDIWALGCLLHYLACQQPPFKITDACSPDDKKEKRSSSPFMHLNPAGMKQPFDKLQATMSRKQILE